MIMGLYKYCIVLLLFICQKSMAQGYACGIFILFYHCGDIVYRNKLAIVDCKLKRPFFKSSFCSFKTKASLVRVAINIV